MSSSNKITEDCAHLLATDLKSMLENAEGLKRVFGALSDQPACIIVQMLIADLTQLETKLPKVLDLSTYSLFNKPVVEPPT
jgi:hypothetical protein